MKKTIFALMICISNFALAGSIVGTMKNGGSATNSISKRGLVGTMKTSNGFGTMKIMNGHEV